METFKVTDSKAAPAYQPVQQAYQPMTDNGINRDYPVCYTLSCLLR